MPTSTELVNFNWLLEDSEPTSETLNNQDIPWTEAPIPKQIGVGGYEGLFLTNDIVIYHSNFQFNPKVSGQLVPLAAVTTKFKEPTLMIQTLAKGRVIHKDKLSTNDLIFGEGVDLFRLCKEISVTPIMDTSTEIDMILVMIGRASLTTLIGEDLASQLLKNLKLLPSPKVVVKQIPSYVNHALQTCLKNEYSPILRKVSAQSKVLEFLSELTKYLCENPDKKDLTSRQAKKRLKDIKQYLMELEGKLPTLNSLAAQFDRSPRLLNDEFQQEYGESIFNFVVNHRLNTAHKVIAQSNVALKHLAKRLGYAHVNHFSAAFKKKFGYAPGSLRK
ncbi:helix-turn-helix transcriptional regulator [Polynucleobacter sp. 80A-SIGWE]|uniref:helix-turn-helix transcriptional regulator n=3 Tax=Polynucleobacter TaxID=44013 RepID=UPI001C0CDC88|nr:AraC family transcriptional regulator [Polynucleobacter sp. 80A-SIGWE]MBU3589519.1 helix-turn-helix transcriptional regulator [Polynucleobacter sp. 80A-SIGWE]